MTADERDSASRLSDALDQLFEQRTPQTDDDTDPTGLGAPPGGIPDEDSSLSHVAAPFAGTHDPEPPSPSLTPEPSLPEPAAPTSSTGGMPYVLPQIMSATDDPPKPAPDPPGEVALVTERPPITPPVPPMGVLAPGRPVPVVPVPAAPPLATTTSVPTSWGDHMPVVTAPPAAELRAAGGRPRVRRVTRVIRHVDPWSVFKVGLIFSAIVYVVLLSSGVLLWRVAESTGSLDNVERWFTQFGWETFEFKGEELFRNAWIIGLFGVVAMTGGFVLLATLFNLVSDIVGGVRVTVLEEEVVERTMSNARRYVVRRPVDAGTGGVAASTWSVDDDEPANAAGSAVDADVVDADVVETAPTESVTVPPTTSNWSVDD